MDAASIDQTTFDLSVKNPNGGEEVALPQPEDIMDEIAALDAESAEVLANDQGAAVKAGMANQTLGDVCGREWRHAVTEDEFRLRGVGNRLR